MNSLRRALHRTPQASADKPLWLQLSAEDLPPSEYKHIIQPYNDQTALEILVWNVQEFCDTLDRALRGLRPSVSYTGKEAPIKSFFHEIANMLHVNPDKTLTSDTADGRVRRRRLLCGLNSIADTQRGLRPAVNRIRTRLLTRMGETTVYEDRLLTKPGDWFENEEHGITTYDSTGNRYVWTVAKPNDNALEPLARVTSTSRLYSWQPSTSPNQAASMSRETWDSRGDWTAVTRPVVMVLVSANLNESLQADRRPRPSRALYIAREMFYAMGVVQSEEKLPSPVAFPDDSAIVLSGDTITKTSKHSGRPSWTPPEDADSSDLPNEQELACIQTCTMTSALTRIPSSTSKQ